MKYLLLLVIILSSCVGHDLNQQKSFDINSTSIATLPPSIPDTDKPNSFSPIAGGINLGRTFTKLESKGNITIAFLGGSITGGAGASDPENSYSALVTQWFTDQFSSKTITSINAGIGGTKSDLGAFRAFSDVGKADLVFIEFAVNDDAQESEREKVMKYTEGIVRRLYRANPKVEIVLVDLASEKTAKWYKNDEFPPVVKWHREIADYYSITGQNAILYVNPGKDLIDTINSGQATWVDGENPMTKDSVHPNDAGHRFIADKIITALQQVSKVYTTLPKFKPLPAPITPDPVQNGKLINIGKATRGNGWSYDESSQAQWSESELSATEIRATLDFRFRGNYIGILLIQTDTEGSFDAWVDEGEVQSFSTKGPFTRRDIALISENAGAGKHTLHVKVSALPVRFLAFMINP